MCKIPLKITSLKSNNFFFNYKLFFKTKYFLNRLFYIAFFSFLTYSFFSFICEWMKGYYVSATQTNENLSKEEMYDVILKEMTIGCEESPDVKAGFIGEIGSTWPITGIYAIMLNIIKYNLINS